MKHSILLIAALVAGSAWCADPIDDLLQASQLMQRRKFAQAAELYGKVAGTAKDAKQLRTSQLYYAICLGKVRGKQAEAMKAAKALKDASLREYAEMSILADNGKSADILKQFADTDLDKWSDKYAHYGWYFRGRAFANRKQYDRGIKELTRAAELAGSDTETRMCAWMEAATAAQAAKKDDLALQFTGKSLQYKTYATSYMFLRPMCIQTEILIRRKQLDEAEKTLALAPAKLGTKQGAWDCNYRMLQGDLALARGNKDEAKKCYEQAKVCAGKMKHLQKECDKKLTALR